MPSPRAKRASLIYTAEETGPKGLAKSKQYRGCPDGWDKLVRSVAASLARERPLLQCNTLGPQFTHGGNHEH